jgi:hypothetical protein
MIVFTPAQARAVRHQRMTAVLTPHTERVRAGSVRPLRRRAVAGENGDARATVEIVCDTALDGERIAVVFTVLAVEDLALAALTLAHARACACRTSDELRAAWRSEHPRTSLARLVTFALGDVRDEPLLLARTGSGADYTHDPSRAMFAEPEPVSPGEQRRLAADAQQRYLRLQADRARELARSTLSERLAAIQAGTVADRRMS